MAKQLEQLTKAQVWAALVARGATQAVVEFSGGNDEGGADSIELLNAKGEAVAKLEEYGSGEVFDPQTKQWVSAVATAEEDGRLADALAAPVYDRWGSFAGDFYVSGTVTWDVATQKVTVRGYEEVRHDEPFEETF